MATAFDAAVQRILDEIKSSDIKFTPGTLYDDDEAYASVDAKIDEYLEALEDREIFEIWYTSATTDAWQDVHCDANKRKSLLALSWCVVSASVFEALNNQA